MSLNALLHKQEEPLKANKQKYETKPPNLDLEVGHRTEIQGTRVSIS